MVFIAFLGFFYEVDFHELFLCVLFGVEDTVEFGALMANSFFIDECTSSVEDLDHFGSAGVQIVFDHGLGGIEDGSYFGYFEFINLF